MGKGSRSSKKQADKGSSAFSFFNEEQVQEYMDGFKIIDRDHDGILGVNDLKDMFDDIGRIVDDLECEEMLAEGNAPMNPSNFIAMFADHMEGENDSDEDIITAFTAFECKTKGTINSDEIRTALMAFGDKFTSEEVDMAFEEMEIDEHGLIDLECLLELFVSPIEA